MEATVKEQTAKPSAQEKRKSIVQTFQEFKDELKKVNWTTKSELQFCTKVVIGAMFVFGIGIYIVDLAIKAVLGGFGALVHLIFG